MAQPGADDSVSFLHATNLQKKANLPPRISITQLPYSVDYQKK